MRWDHITRLRAAMLAVVVLLCPLMPIAWVQAESAPMASILPTLAQTSEGLWLDDDVSEFLFSEAIVFLVCALGCGLLLGGMEAVDLWCERRDERKRPRIRVPALAPRGNKVDS